MLNFTANWMICFDRTILFYLLECILLFAYNRHFVLRRKLITSFYLLHIPHKAIKLHRIISKTCNTFTEVFAKEGNRFSLNIFLNKIHQCLIIHNISLFRVCTSLFIQEFKKKELLTSSWLPNNSSWLPNDLFTFHVSQLVHVAFDILAEHYGLFHI